MRLSTFCVVKNEIYFIGYHIMSILDHVDEMVFYDNSTDGTTETIEYIQKKYDKSGKIKLFKGKDCKDLKDDYARLFDECLRRCSGDYVWFIHPDMICINPDNISKIKHMEGLRASIKIHSVAGEDRELLIADGRTDRWATIFKNNFGLHYYGHYGSSDEDMYFRYITGDEHIFYKKLNILPYVIQDTDIELIHYCDTKPYTRRLGRMEAVLTNVIPGADLDTIKQLSIAHPRVTLQSGEWNGTKFTFKENDLEVPSIFKKYKKEFEPLRRV